MMTSTVLVVAARVSWQHWCGFVVRKRGIGMNNPRRVGKRLLRAKRVEETHSVQCLIYNEVEYSR